MKDTFRNIDNIEFIEVDRSRLENEFDDFLKLKNYNSELHFHGKDYDTFNRTKLGELKDYLDNDKAYVYGAYDDNKLIGFIWGYPHIFFDEKRIFVNSIVVAKEYEKKGIGRKLISKIENLAIDKGFDSIDLTVAPNNVNAVGFYEHLGFQSERIQLFKKVNNEEK